MSAPRTLIVMTEKKYVTKEEAARIVGVSLRQIRRWRESGELVFRYDPSFRRPAECALADVRRLKRELEKRT